MDTNTVIITEKQYREYTEFLDSNEGIMYEQIIHRINNLENNQELISVSISGVPGIPTLARFPWMYSILDVLVNQERKIQMSTIFAVPLP